MGFLSHFIYNSGLNCIRLIKMVKTNFYLKRISRHRPDGNKIKVGFIVQMPEIWDKEAPVFEYMISDKRFNPYLIVLPSYNIVNSSLNDYGEEYMFFSTHYENSRIIKAFENRELIDLEKQGFDYVFYQRCWENYIPREYRTDFVIRYAKTCYIPYDLIGTYEGKSFYNSSFFRSLYICFSSSREQVSFYKKSRYRKNVFLGAPVLESFLMKNEKRCGENHCFSILWTPRWTDDVKYGGSSFLRDMYNILSLKEEYSSIDLVLRPHPLSFQNAIKQGNLSESDINRYFSTVDSKGARFDKNKNIEDTFLITDILITDFSAVVPQFFMSGKPVIYCGNPNICFEPAYKRMTSAFYFANEWVEVEKHVHDLVRGIDPLKEKRTAIIESMKNDHRGSTKRIADYIHQDWISSKGFKED